ncbi:hypothetical protein CDAR_99731 [Caerostris darwini]|uniref:Uncharacterized protein n=1 Tax=Caerostris darwini TaxID=1538125 RepID=A0AAV4SRN5_9ARAC|nr:hypothetical protein CDAR_99731 [Caerostris darwini]
MVLGRYGLDGHPFCGGLKSRPLTTWSWDDSLDGRPSCNVIYFVTTCFRCVTASNAPSSWEVEQFLFQVPFPRGVVGTVPRSSIRSFGTEIHSCRAPPTVTEDVRVRRHDVSADGAVSLE